MCSLCCLCTSPVTPISNWPSVRPTAAPRFESRRCDLCQSRGEDKPDSPTISKWQIGLGQWMKPYRGGAGTAGGAKRPPRGVPRGGPPLGDSLVTFSSGRKSPGCRAERLHLGECRGGSTPSHFAPLQRPLLLLYHTPLPPVIPKKRKVR